MTDDGSRHAVPPGAGEGGGDLSRRAVVLAGAALAGAAAALVPRRSRASTTVTPVPREALVEAFAAQQRLGYRLDRIGHAGRLQAGVLLHLATPRPGALLRVDHRDYEQAYRQVTGLAREQLPSFVREAAQAGEDLLVDTRTEAVVDGTPPTGLRRALNVKAGWPAVPGAPASYRYLDTSSQPHVETQRDQVGTWRLLDYGDAVVLDEIEGLSGRARSGLLGALFDVIGSARVLRSRFAGLPDGGAVVHTTVRSALTVSRSAWVTPGGEVVATLPSEREDVLATEARLLALELPARYRALDRSPMPPRPA